MIIGNRLEAKQGKKRLKLQKPDDITSSGFI